MYVLSIVVCPFVLFLLAIVLSVLLRYTVFDCPFDIFKLFLLSIISIRNLNNVIPNISSKPNVTNKKTMTDNSFTWQETLQTNWLTVEIIHYSNDNGSFFFPLQQRKYLPSVLYETGTDFLPEHQSLPMFFWWFHVAILSYFSVLCLVPDVDDISELSIFDCPFGFL